MFDKQNTKIAIIGLGYVGLPLAVEFGKQYKTIGFDINEARINELTSGHDSTLEMSEQELTSARQLSYTSDYEELKQANIYIVTVPTPIDRHKQPDLTPLVKASEMLGKVISPDNIVIYESTVFPGATEEVCIPIVEKLSGLTYNRDFFAGYSPERINPGDKSHRLPNILKVTSGSNPEVASYIDALYSSIITAGTHKASSIKVAEAAKVIENTQRDVNIALINELAIIFNKLGIDTLDVLEAAGTKWNFLPFRPGLVGGHCIGVDPFYLTHKAQAEGYHPEMILAGRRLNDGMAHYIVSQLIKAMLTNKVQVEGAKVLIMGLTFKENCPDLRNTKVIDIVKELKEYHIEADVHDPWCDKNEAKEQYDIDLVEPKDNYYDAIIVAVAHKQFIELPPSAIKALGKNPSVIYDLKYVLDKEVSTLRL